MANRVHVLHGGYLNEGGVTRQGRYVIRRQDHPWPEAVDEAMEVLASRGFSCCPQLVTRTDPCSVTLTYLSGRALSNPVPRWAATADTLIRVTRFVSAFSVAATGMRPNLTKTDWLTQPDSAGNDLVHGDPHPTNLIFSACRRPTGLIDFELATLGPGIWNLISLIFGWAPLEPVSVTCWRHVRGLCPVQRIQIILRHWHTRVSALELIGECLNFVRWRKNWISALADMGNEGARNFAADPGFDSRLNHAINLMTEACEYCVADFSMPGQAAGPPDRRLLLRSAGNSASK